MWTKKGVIFKNEMASLNWNVSHAQVPVAHILQDHIRIYYSSRDLRGISRISYIEVLKTDLNQITYIHDQPVLELGSSGTFDDSGTMPTSILSHNNQDYLYYIGWTQKKTVPFHNSIGVAKIIDGYLEKVFEGPIITTTKDEPYFSGTAYIIKKDEKFLMFYLSCIGWIDGANKKEPLYNLKVAKSNDAFNWTQSNEIAIDLEHDEGGLASASVLEIKGFYIMWFSVRKKVDYRKNKNNSYRIKTAISQDGENWRRINDPTLNLEISESGWDSEMVAYPNVIKLENELIMFYNGNGFGQTGFGYATMPISDVEKFIISNYEGKF